MTGLYCPGCHTEHASLEYNDPQPGDIIICTRCAELGEYDGQALRNVPMTSTKRTHQIVERQVYVFAQHIDYTISRLLHPSSGR